MSSAEQDGGARSAILNVVGLTRRHLGEHTPRLQAFAERENNALVTIEPVLPAVTCTAQATYLTGKSPSEHGIVANGWYDRILHEHHFWKQSNRLVDGEKIWETLRRERPDLTCAMLFWWFNMHSTADYSITPRPLYRSDGLKTFDVHSHPLSIRDAVKADLGDFPFASFWGPKAGIESTRWIAESAKWIEEKHSPDLSLVYLPHLDYDLQRFGPNHPGLPKELRAVDEVAGNLIDFLETRNVRVVILSEYGITEAKKVIYPNRALRTKGWLNLKEELGLEYLDCGGSRAFAITDHQIAHVYLNDDSPVFVKQVRSALEELDGIAQVLDQETRKEAGLDHDRAGDLIAIAEEGAWFAYYHWEDDAKAPDFARCVDVHRKYGYDPVELFVDSSIPFPTAKAAFRLLQKKLGFRIFMDLIPLDATLVKGTHGAMPADKDDWPLLIGNPGCNLDESIPATKVHDLLLELCSK
ncbi:MAG: nucleotide pyrophosphatase/phosphodiesterase family protein [Opitutales bacterium]